VHLHLTVSGVVCILSLQGRQEQCSFTTRLRVLKLFTLSYRDLERLQGVTTDNVYGNSFAHPVSCQEYLEVLRVVDRVTIECDQDITEHESTFLSGAILIHFDDEQAMLLRRADKAAKRPTDLKANGFDFSVEQVDAAINCEETIRRARVMAAMPD